MALSKSIMSWRRRLPMVYQAEGAECGLACIAMIAAFHGHHVSVAQLRGRVGFSLRGANLERLIQVATQLQLRARAMRIEVEDLRRIDTPCVLHWDMTHFVVLERSTRDGVRIHDPAFGVRNLRWSEVSRSFTGVAVELSPTATFEPESAAPAVTLSQLTGRTTGLKSTLTQILLLSVAIQSVLLCMPFLMQWTIDHVVPASDTSLLSLLGASFLLLLLVQVGLTTTRSWALAYLSTTLSIQWTSNVLAHLLKLPLEYFQKRHLGDIVSRSSSVNSIQRTLTSSFVEAIVDGLMTVMTLSLMLAYSSKLTVLVLAALAVYAFVRFASFKYLRSETEKQVISAARQQTHLLETLRGVQTIKISNTQGSRLADWYNLLVGTNNHGFKIARLNILFSSTNSVLFGSERIIVIWVGVSLVIGGSLSVGMLVAFLAYREQFALRVTSLVDKLMEFRMMRMHCERLADIVLSSTEPMPDPLGEELGQPLFIEVDDVSFRYADGEPWILRNCSFRVEAGEALALVGASGCGKTTLLKLMLGLLEPTSGKIRFMGRYSAPQVRGHIAAVMQDDVLFGGSIADNIGLFSPSIDRERMISAAVAAGIDGDIRGMPMGYDTLVGDMGAAMSGGQKQRVLLARALYQKPKVLFLDEATSHLDVERERAVNVAVRGIATTRVIVAHRSETIASADRVLRVHSGRVHSCSALPNSEACVLEV